jgi:acyl-coenzyme A synthetase/AMP-(fatty) acid ligase
VTAETRPRFFLASQQIGTHARPSGRAASSRGAPCSNSIRERIAAYKYPRVIEIRDELPKNALGKILKDQLLPR